MAAGLSDLERTRALELGPADVAGEASLRGLLERAGFHVDEERDVTSDFRDALDRRLEALRRHEAALRGSEGDEQVDSERDKRTRMLTGVDEGLLRRTIVLGRSGFGLERPRGSS
jgi:hypothetical protein